MTEISESKLSLKRDSTRKKVVDWIPSNNIQIPATFAKKFDLLNQELLVFENSSDLIKPSFSSAGKRTPYGSLAICFQTPFHPTTLMYSGQKSFDMNHEILVT